MPISRICSRPAATVTLACLSLGGGALLAPAALGAKHRPSTVKVEVLGKPPASRVLLRRTVALPTKPVDKYGGSCAGQSAAGALQAATKGAWGGTWDAEYSDYEVTKIAGLSLPFKAKAAADWYWSFLVDGKESSAGVCVVKPKPGETLEFRPACYGKACPKAPKTKRGALATPDAKRR